MQEDYLRHTGINNKMKKIFSIVLICGLIINMPLNGANAGCVSPLSDEELDTVCAGGLTLDINKINAVKSGAILQNNTGFSYAGLGGIADSSMVNSNTGTLTNHGNSGVIAQNNMAIAFAQKGDISGLRMDNYNYAVLENHGTDSMSASGISGGQFELNSGEIDINRFNASNAGLAMQNNIAGVIAMDGDISDVVINNTNVANVVNFGSAAVAAQNNFALAIASGSLDNVTINNVNNAVVSNTLNGFIGQVDLKSMTFNTGTMNITVNSASGLNSAGVLQNNIAITALLGGSGTASEININNINTASVTNNL